MVLVKKYWILTATAVLLSALFLFLPAMTDGLVTRVVLTRPAAVSAASDILVSGIVEQQAQTELYTEIPVVIGEVLADAGDTVSAGQPIATVDLNATKNALVSLLKAVEVIPEEYLAAFSNVHVDESMLSAVIPETLSAPASGTLLTSSLSPGQLITPQSPAAVIGKGGTLRVKLTVPEDAIETVKAGNLAVFKTSATGAKRYGAIVTQISPAAEQTISGTSQQTVVYVYATVCTDAAELRPGYTVMASIKDTEHSNETTMLVPYEAVLQDDVGTEYVYLYESGRAVRRDVVTGEEYETGIAITEGLAGTELLVENASEITRDGMVIAWKEDA